MHGISPATERRILAQMGIPVWVSQQTILMPIDHLSNEQMLTNADHRNADALPLPSQIASTTSVSIAQRANQYTHQLPADDADTPYHQSASAIENPPLKVYETLTADYVEGYPDSDVNVMVAETIQDYAIPAGVHVSEGDVEEMDAPAVCAPFELVGVCYQHWVLLVDASVLQDTQLSQLWQNIVTALSVEPLRISFPLCKGMNQLDLANATVAGFVYRLMQSCPSSSDIFPSVAAGMQSVSCRVGALSTLPDGVDHDLLVRLPYLTEMLQDARHKKQLWQLLCTS